MKQKVFDSAWNELTFFYKAIFFVILYIECLANQTRKTLNPIISVSHFYHVMSSASVYLWMDLKSDWIFEKTTKIGAAPKSQFFFQIFIIFQKTKNQKKNSHFQKKIKIKKKKSGK